MSRSKHTPGPWKVDTVSTTIEFINAKVIHSPDDYIHACLMGSDKTQEANANLIAAAPELLECLNHLFYNCEAKTTIEWIFKIKEAIAKAKGQS